MVAGRYREDLARLGELELPHGNDLAMGIYDREYYRGEDLGSHSSGNGLPMVTNLVIISAVFYVLDIFTPDHWLMQTMAASPNSVVKPWLSWQLLTYGFAHSWLDKWHIIANMFGLWMFGRDVEGVYGRWEILRIYLLTIVLGGLVWAVRASLTVDPRLWDGYIVLGASGAVTCIILLFCFLFPRRTVLLMFIFPAPAWVLGLLIVIMNVVGMRMPGSDKVAYDVHLVGAAFAFGYYRFGWNLGRWIPRLSFPSKWFKPGLACGCTIPVPRSLRSTRKRTEYWTKSTGRASRA